MYLRLGDLYVRGQRWRAVFGRLGGFPFTIKIPFTRKPAT